VLSASRLTFAAGAAAAVVLLGATGCTGLDEASAASITRDTLISELATQLAEVSGLTYTATYQLAGGHTATIVQAQKPTRTVYAYPGARVLVTAADTVRCNDDKNPTICTATSTLPSADPGITAMITPGAVLAMLNTAALDEDATAAQHDTTIAGRHATCLNLSGVEGTPAARFTVCVTNEGALGSFAATIDDKRADVALTTYSDKADADAFAVPVSAKLIDKRPK
jgi:hypothetical protein